MVIEDLTKDSIPSFYEVFCNLMREGYDNFSPKLQEHFINFDYPLKNWYYWYEKSLRKVLLAKSDSDEVIGFIVGDHSYGGVAFITWLGVIPEFRRKGVGTKILKEYESYVDKKSAHLIELYTFPKVQGFYERHGYHKIGVRPEGYYGRKNIIMDKKLRDWNESVLAEI